MSSEFRETTMAFNRETLCNAKIAAALIAWGAALCLAFWTAPYLYAFNDLIQWR